MIANQVQLINFVKCIVFMDIVSEMHIFAAFGGMSLCSMPFTLIFSIECSSAILKRSLHSSLLHFAYVLRQKMH